MAPNPYSLFPFPAFLHVAVLSLFGKVDAEHCGLTPSSTMHPIHPYFFGRVENKRSSSL